MPCYWSALYILAEGQPGRVAGDAPACASSWILPGAVLSPSGRRPVVCALLTSGVSEVVMSPGDPAVAPMACAYERLCAAELGGLCPHVRRGQEIGCSVAQ